jgi:GT2 family glycosyltransferase
MKTVDVSIIIVNYNAREFLERCIASLFATISGKVTYEVIIIDNDSSDGSAEKVRNIFGEKIKLIESKENLGFSKGNNLGIGQAHGRYILFLNPDTEMKAQTLETMVSFMDEHERAGAATCFVRLEDGSLDDGAHRGFPTPWNSFCYFSGLAKVFPRTVLFNGYNLGFRDLHKIHEIDALVGAFMLVRREAGDEVHWWDEDYFFYGEDLDFCYNLKEKNWEIYFVPTVEILHYKGVSGGIKKHSEHLSTADRSTKVRATRERFKAMRTFYKKHYMKKYPGIITWLVFKGVDWKLKRALSEVST